MNPVLFGPKFIYYLFIYGRSLAAPCAAPLVEASHLSHQSDWSSAAPSSPRPPLVIFPWSPVASRGLPWPPVASRGLPWPPVASRDLPWPPVTSCGPPVASHGLPWLCSYMAIYARRPRFSGKTLEDVQEDVHAVHVLVGRRWKTLKEYLNIFKFFFLISSNVFPLKRGRRARLP